MFLVSARKGFQSALRAPLCARRLLSSAPAAAPPRDAVLASFRAIVGTANVLDPADDPPVKTASYLKGQRLGHGRAPAIALPTRLGQVPRLVEAAVDAGCAVVVQGTNTGLTGGSVPRGDGDDRPAVVISTRRLNAILPVDHGERVLCLAGVGLGSLKNFVAQHFPGRQSHSTLGSNFLNPTTAAGVAFGSGGTQIRKGPSTTERALYLKVDAAPEGSGKKSVVKVVNTLGIQGLDDVEGECTILSDDNHGNVADEGVIPKLDSIVDEISEGINKNHHDHKLVSNTTYGTHPSHDENYKKTLCTFDDGLTRYNADTKGLDCNRSEGKVFILATVHETFREPDTAKTFWVSFQDLATAIRFKTHVALTDPDNLPETLEYMDRGCFEVIDRAGRFMGHFIKYFGADHPMVARGWALKLMVESLPGLSNLPDMVQYHLNQLLPPVLSSAVMNSGRHRQHHIVTTVGDYDGSGSLQSFEKRLASFCKENEGAIDVHELATAAERDGANAFRYTAAAAFPTYCVGTNLQGISVDYALPKNRSEAPELPPKEMPAKRMRYSHFACNVVHEDLAYEQGVDTHSAKMKLKHIVDEVCGGRLPSEHGHGTEYVAPLEAKQRWMKMDPLNVMNPGVGGLSTKYQYE